jgi:magnesium transporter
MPVHAYLYDAEGRDQEVDLTAELLKSIQPQQLLWVDADAQDGEKLDGLGRLLELDPASLKRFREPEFTRVENYGPYMQFAVPVAPATRAHHDDEAAAQPAANEREAVLQILVVPRWLLTVHNGPLDYLESFRSQDRAETAIGSLTTFDFAASFLDAHLETYFEEIARIEAMTDRLDEQALINPSGKSLLGRMVALRRRVSRLRASLARQRGIFYGLSRPDLQLAVEAGAAPHFQVLTGRFERAIDEVEHTRDLIVGSFELFSSRAAQQTNELVKVLTF